MRRALPVVAVGLSMAAGGLAWAMASPDTLRRANAAAAAAARQAARLEARAAASDDPAARARLSQAAVAARVRGAEAEIAAAQSRSALVDGRLAAQRERLAAQEGPVARLLATLTGFARRPAIVGLVQPASLADVVHVQAVLTTTMPAIAARTVAIRGEIAQARTLQASAALARRSLETGRSRLVEARDQLAALEDGSEAAQAVDERSRDIVEQLRGIGGAQETLGELVALPGPPVPASAERRAGGAYRLPVTGRLVTGLGEVSDNGVRARGLTFAVAPDAGVVAPAAGRIVFAGPFRSFGRVVIVDHGEGWTTLVAGLATQAVRAGDMVAQGTALGRAGRGDGPRITVELRRRGRPADIVALLG